MGHYERDSRTVLKPIKSLLIILGRRRRAILLTLCILSALASAMEVCGLALVFPLIKLMTDPTFLRSSATMTMVYDTLGIESERVFTTLLAGAIFSIFCLKNLYITALFKLQAVFTRNGMAALSRRLQGHYLYAPYSVHLQRNSAELIRNIRHVVVHSYRLAIPCVIGLFADGLAVVGIALALFIFQPTAFLAAAAVIAFLFGIQHQVFGKRFKGWGAQTLEISADAYKQLQQALSAIKEIKVLGREDYFLDSLNDLHWREAKALTNQQFLGQVIFPLTEVVTICAIMVVVTIILLSGEQTQEALPTLALFAAAAIRLMPSLNRIFRWLASLRGSEPGLDVLSAELDRFGNGAEPAQMNWKGDEELQRTAFANAITMADIAFSYPEMDRPALRHVDATILYGQFVGIVGPSGAGKSTLMDLLLGLLLPSHGRLLVDGQDVATNPQSWQCNIGYVPQEIYIIDDSLRRNVAFGIDDHLIDDERVKSVLRLVSLQSLCSDLPAGLDTVLGEYGKRVSGGQRQRIGIARALYHDPSVLVLDEATSDLDTETEFAITEVLQDLKGTKTIIVIAHRLSTVKDCDTILFLKDGELVDSGTLEELCQRNMEMRQLVRLAELREIPDRKAHQSG